MSTYTAPDGTPYSSAGMPISTRTLTIKRGDGSTAGGGATPTTIGTYLAEGFNPQRQGSEIRRKGQSGEATDLAVVRGAESGSCTIQRATTTTKMPDQGDYFEETIDGDTGTTRFVVLACTKAETAGSPHTYNLTFTQDIENSPKYTA